jgi:tetratricopeptide (TPR) repeat protein
MPPSESEALAPVAQALAHAARLLPRAPTLAAEQARAVLAAVPGHPEAEYILGGALRRQGDAPAARVVLENLAAAQPRSAHTHYELALTLAALGESAGAIAALRRCTALAPGFSDAWRGLGDLLMLQGDAPGADAAYARHIRAAVNDPDLIRAADALCQGELGIAERLLKNRLKIHPTDVAALRMLGETATRLGRNLDAENLLRQCLELAPSFAAPRHNLAVVLYRQGKAREAIPLLERLLQDSPRDPNYRSLLAACLGATGEFDRAIEVYGAVIGEMPRQPKIWMSYGHALRAAGRREESVAAYHRSIELAPTCGEAFWSLANLKTVPFTDAQVSAMQDALARPDLGDDDRLHMHYALGRALEMTGDYQRSFTNYAAGARIRRGQVRYSAADTNDAVQRAKSVFDAAFFARHEGAGCPDPAPVFVVGLPRSGSTLIEQILSSHSVVEGTMELPDMAILAREIGGGAGAAERYPACLDTLPADAIAALGRNYIERTRHQRKLGKTYFIDKMPNNWVHAGLIRLILPQAKIIDARRHPMAAGFSSFKQHFARGQNFSYDLTELGLYYRDYLDLMAHIDAVQPGAVHRVLYEDMVEHTEREIRRLLDYCGLPFEEACLRFHQTRRAVRTASSEQVRRPIFRQGLDHWRHYAPWLGELEAALAGERA